MAQDPQSAGCTCMRLRKAARRVSQIYDQHLQESGVTVTQYGLLAHLRAMDGVAIGELAEKLVMDPTTLTRNLRPLEREGHLVIARDPHDKRSRRLHLTAAGREAFEKARPGWLRAQRHLEETLGEADASGLNAALDAALARLAT